MRGWAAKWHTIEVKNEQMIMFFCAMIHGIKEGHQAAELAQDRRSAWRLRLDFLYSRLLRLGKMPGYDGERTVRWRTGAILCYRLNRGDLQSVREVMVEEAYDCELPSSLRTVLDLGANIGLLSLWLAGRIRSKEVVPGAGEVYKFVAVEAAPANAQVAVTNFRMNQVPGEVIAAAVGLHSGETWFELRSESNLGSRVMENDGNNCVRLPVIGIRTLLGHFPEGKVDLVKMDIEGGEADLLGHDTDWLSSVNSLMVEWHDDRVESGPLIANVVAAGFIHKRINVKQQDNLSLFTRNLHL